MRDVPLRRTARIALIVMLCAIAVGVSRPSSAGAMTRSELRLLHVVNDTRASHGLRRVRVVSTLQTASHAWARYLRQHSAFFHGRLSAGTSENIGWLSCRQGWARTLVRMWLNSPAHRVHLLDRSARRIGVGLAKGPWSGWSCVRVGVTRFR